MRYAKMRLALLYRFNTLAAYLVALYNSRLWQRIAIDSQLMYIILYTANRQNHNHP